MSDSDRVTLVPCASCGGNFRTYAADGQPAPRGTSKTLRVLRCPWCSEGAMTQEQLRAYVERPKRASGEIVLTPTATLSPALTCEVCGEPITSPNTLASARSGFRHVSCEEAPLPPAPPRRKP